jgi:hypothetical protein
LNLGSPIQRGEGTLPLRQQASLKCTPAVQSCTMGVNDCALTLPCL